MRVLRKKDQRKVGIERFRGRASEPGYGYWIVGAIYESPLHNKRKPRSLLSKIVGYFKMNTAKEINMVRGTPGTPFWQRGYYEHVIRAEK